MSSDIYFRQISALKCGLSMLPTSNRQRFPPVRRSGCSKLSGKPQKKTREEEEEKKKATMCPQDTSWPSAVLRLLSSPVLP